MENEDKDLGKLHNQEDVNPTSQLDKLADEDKDQETLPETNGTGSNNPVPTSGTVIIKDDDDGKEKDEQKE